MRIPATPISPYVKLETKPPIQTDDSQFQFSQFMMKCNSFSLVASTAMLIMVSSSLRLFSKKSLNANKPSLFVALMRTIKMASPSTAHACSPTLRALNHCMLCPMILNASSLTYGHTHSSMPTTCSTCS